MGACVAGLLLPSCSGIELHVAARRCPKRRSLWDGKRWPSAMCTACRCLKEKTYKYCNGQPLAP